MNDQSPALPTEELFTNAPYDEALLGYLFGDDEADPGPLFERFTHDTAAHGWLEAFVRDYPKLNGRPDSPAVGRATALLAELRLRASRTSTNATATADVSASRAAVTSDVSASRAAVTSDVSASRAAGTVDVSAATVVSLAERRAQKSRLGPRLAIFGVLAATIAAAAFLAVSVGKTPREVDIGMAQALVAPIMEQGGHGFAGAPIPTARERGFLIGAITDLSRPRKATGQIGDNELELARNLADRALEGVDDAPDAAEGRRVRLLGGCAAILSAPEDRKACEEGLADYQRRRDAY